MTYPSAAAGAAPISDCKITPELQRAFFSMLREKKIAIPEPLTLTSYNQLLHELLSEYVPHFLEQSAPVTDMIQSLTELRTDYEKHLDSVTLYLKKLQHIIYIDFLTHVIEKFQPLATKPSPEIVRHALLEILIADFNYQLHEPLPGTEALRFPTLTKIRTMGRKTSSSTVSKITAIEAYFSDLFAGFNTHYHVSDEKNTCAILFSMYQQVKWLDNNGQVLPAKTLEQFQQPSFLKKYFDGSAQSSIEKLMQERYPKIANKIPFVTYSLDLKPIVSTKPETTIALIGCHGMEEFSNIPTQGNAADKQKDIAKLIKAANCDLGLQLGDNVYYNGIGTMEGNYYAVNQALYGTRNNLGSMFWAFAAGNHDYGIWGHANTDVGESLFRRDPNLRRQNGLQRVLNQVLHTYTNNDCLHMPNRYYVLDYDYFAILVIDSNTLIYDEPQQHWIRSTIERLKPSKQWIGVAAHHPLIYMGKRAEHKCEWDTYVKSTIGAKDPWFTTADHYQPLMVTPTGLHKIDSPQKGHKHKYNNIGKFLLAFINHNELPIDVWLCAHEHFLGVMKLTTAKGNTITQITSGGAGAEVKLDSIRYVDPAGNYNTKNEYTISPHLDEAKLQCELAAEQYGFFTLTLSKLKITCTPTLVENPKPDKFVFIREGNTINGELCFTCATAV